MLHKFTDLAAWAKVFKNGTNDSIKNEYYNSFQSIGSVCMYNLSPGEHAAVRFLGIQAPANWSVYNMPATLADVRVAKTPEKSAESATRETSPERPGAIWPRTPIAVPRDPTLPKPYRHEVSQLSSQNGDLPSFTRWGRYLHSKHTLRSAWTEPPCS